MQSLGDYRVDDYISFGVQLHRFSSGAVYAPTGNATYTFYEDNSTSGAPTGGNLAQLNSKTGLYTARVQLTGANGFEAGKEYFVHIEATVDSVAAAELFHFRVVANPKVDLDTIKTQAITCGAGVTVLASVGTAATSTAQTADHTANIAAIKTKTDNLPTDPADQSAVEAAITAAHSTTNGYIDTEIGTLVTELAKVPKSDSNVTWNATALAAINAEADTAISDAGIVTHLTDLKGTTFDSATDSNEAIRNRGDAAWVTATGFSTFNPATDTVARVTLTDTCTTNTDMRGTDNGALASVCTEARLSELDAGTAGKAAHQIDIIQTDTTTDIPALIAAAEAKIDTIDGIVDDILVDSGTTLDGKLDDLLEALVYKIIFDESTGAAEMFNAANTSLGTIAAAIVSDSGYTTRKKMVI